MRVSYLTSLYSIINLEQLTPTSGPSISSLLREVVATARRKLKPVPCLSSATGRRRQVLR